MEPRHTVLVHFNGDSSKNRLHSYEVGIWATPEREGMAWEKVVELAVSYGLAGFLFAIAANRLVSGEITEAILYAIAGSATVFLSGFVKAVLDQVQEALKKRVADWIVSGLEVLWWRLTSQFKSSYYQSLIYAYRDYQPQGIKTKGPFTLDLEKVFVPLRVAPESLDRIPSALIQPRGAVEHRQIWDFLTAIPSQPAFRRIVVIAPPGLGKTTLLEHLALTYAQNAQRRYHRKAPILIPVLIYLREVREAIASDNPPSLPDLIQRQDLVHKLNPPPTWFATRLKQGKCLVMLDGLDEVADSHQRQKVSYWVDRQIQNYPGNTFILTSRPFGYRSAPLSEAGIILEVQPFSLKQMKQFIQNWYLQNEIMSRLGKDDAGVRAVAQRQADDLVGRIERNPPLAAMALNPLLLTMIATVHRYRGTLPGRRVDLYAEICDVLLGPRQQAKGIADTLTPIQKKSVLQALALKGMQRKTREFKLITACLLIREPLAALAGRDSDPEAFLRQIEDVSGLLTQREQDIYEFAHRSFQEYLAAVQLKELGQEFLLTRHIDDPWWDETIRLYAAQGDASNVIWAALQKPTVVTLTLAYECLEEGLSVEPDVRRQLEDALEKGLHSTDSEIFKLAAEVKLSRRLRKLLRIDELTDIDTTYISRAEYQLFVDEINKADPNQQIDYWSTLPLTGNAVNEPVVGVQAATAESFCVWLTQRSSVLGDVFLEGEDLVFVGDSRFRLPTVTEMQDYPMLEPQIGCWCQNGETLVLAGIDSARLQAWQQALTELLMPDFDQVVAIAHNRSSDAAEAVVSDPQLKLAQALMRDLVLDYDLTIASDLTLARAYNLTRNLALDLAVMCDRAQSQILTQRSICDLARDLSRDLSRDLTHAEQVKQPSDFALSQIRGYLTLFFAAWSVLSDTYEKAAKNRRILQAIDQTRKDCNDLNRLCQTRRTETLDLYVFFALLDERRSERFSAWESIRIVREKISR